MFVFPSIAKIEKMNAGLIFGNTIWFRKTVIPKINRYNDLYAKRLRKVMNR